MKNRIHKILGIGLALVLALALVAGFAVPVAAAETINEWYKFDYPVEGADGDWFYDPDIAGMRELTQAINGDLYVYAYIDGEHEVLKSEDGGRTWALTKYSDATDGVVGGRVFDMVCSSIDEDIVYAVDPYYVYKTTDGGDTWTFLAKDSLEEALGGACGCDLESYSSDWIISSIDVAYDDDDNPFVFIGTREHYVIGGLCVTDTYYGSVFWIGEAGYPATWADLDLSCFAPAAGTSTYTYEALAVGCAPDWADSKETYVVVTSYSDNRTFVVSTIGVTCSWTEVAELLYDCETGNDFDIFAASRIAFPDDWEDTETLFVGVTDFGLGGDVYSVTSGLALDRNVAGITTGCEGIDPVDIISLDIMGDMDEASLIAGTFSAPYVYYSYDGGWSWDISAKEPTGERWTYVIWYEDTALAATWGDECAVSMSCVSDDVEDVGEAWSQISLISTDIESVLYIDHSPGYLCGDSETMFMLTFYSSGCGFSYQQHGYADTQSLFRYDGTYWERVFCNVIAGVDHDEGSEQLQRVRVSPDFNDTNCVYVTNSNFEIWRSLDAGCSWDKLTFPCSPRPDISAAVVIDEDTVIAGGAGDELVYKTTRHGARPWDEYDVTGAGDANFFALEPGYEDPGSILLGDDDSQVFISEDGGETWDLVGDFLDVVGDDNEDTWVIFDPGYATNNIIYAAAWDVIARCIIDPDEDMADQEWEVIYTPPDVPKADLIASGIAAVGDTVLYVTDREDVQTFEEDCDDDEVDEFFSVGGVVRSLNPDAEDADDVVFERITDGLVFDGFEGDDEDATELRHLWLTCDTSDEGCAENVLWSLEQYDTNKEYIWVYEDTLAAPVVLDMPLDEQKLTTTDSATLSWNALCGADCYEVALWSYCAECPDEKLEIDLDLDCCPADDDSVTCGIECDDFAPCTEDICIVVGPTNDFKGLEPGTTYSWQVRVCQGKPTLSKWSEERTFMTALPAVVDLCSPVCGGQDIILTTNFSWDAVDGATGYDIELATTETFTAGVVRGSSTVNAWVTEPLEYATTYYWRVRAEKDGVYSDWTVCIFTTIEEPVPAPPPVVVEPTPPAPVVPAPIIELPPTPSWVWAIIAIGTALVVVVIVLTVRTRRPPA